MPTLSLSSLDVRTLARRLGELASDERRVQVEFLLHLEEFDRRRAWAELGHGSLWTFCLTELHLREGSAGRRIAAMRVLRRFPRLAEALRDGRPDHSSQVGPWQLRHGNGGVPRPVFGSEGSGSAPAPSRRPRGGRRAGQNASLLGFTERN